MNEPMNLLSPPKTAGMTVKERTRLLRVVAPTMPDAPKRPYLNGKRDKDLQGTVGFDWMK